MDVKRLHHVGIPVESIEKSRPFYEKVLGLVDTGIRAGGSGEVIAEALRVQDADVNVMFMRVGEHVVVELLEYAEPKGEPYTLRNCDVGALHLCFETDDIEAAYEELREAGVQLHHEPIALGPESGGLAGYKFLYFRDPDGITLEFFELPPGKDY
jgi:catechol 2,3-dioxygenase-like lactoylglutathione lyase family enzyme